MSPLQIDFPQPRLNSVGAKSRSRHLADAAATFTARVRHPLSRLNGGATSADDSGRHAMQRVRISIAAGLAGLSLGLAAPACTAPKVTPVAGAPFLGLGAFDLKALGYTVEEFFIAGPASSYKLVGEAAADGRWQAAPSGTADYATRIVVVRPTDPKRFNSAVAVEWLNVTGGVDAAPDWSYEHREMLRRGYAYVGVSAQKVGVEGGPSMGGGVGGGALKKAYPDRYGPLHHPGDVFAFDIFSDAGRVVRSGGVLGPLKARRVLAIGESQSAVFLTTYVNAIDPLAKVYDGFLIHSRFGSAPLPEAAGMRPAAGAPRAPDGVWLRTDLRAPVLTLISETDLIGSGLAGFWAARQPDNSKLRIWEMAGTSHADNYIFIVSGSDSGKASIETLAAGWKPTTTLIVGKMAKPINAAPQHHYVASSALAHLDAWVRTGRAPPVAPRLQITQATPPKLVLDDLGNAKGGIRSPWMDAPTSTFSGFGNSGGAFAFLLGTTEPFDAATLKRLYPGGRADYLRRFDAELAKMAKAGFILPEDTAEARALAAAAYPEK
jgi:hypothetical protein